MSARPWWSRARRAPKCGIRRGSATATGKTKNSRMAFMRSTTPNIAHLPYPYPYRPIANVADEELAELYVRLFEQALDTNLAPEHVAAVIIEPVQGEGGFVVPPARF